MVCNAQEGFYLIYKSVKKHCFITWKTHSKSIIPYCKIFKIGSMFLPTDNVLRRPSPKCGTDVKADFRMSAKEGMSVTLWQVKQKFPKAR